MHLIEYFEAKGEILGVRGHEALFDRAAHEVEGGVFTGPGFELAGGLADEHLDTGDGPGAGGAGGLEEAGFDGVVDGVEDEVFGGEGDVGGVTWVSG